MLDLDFTDAEQPAPRRGLLWIAIGVIVALVPAVAMRSSDPSADTFAVGAPDPSTSTTDPGSTTTSPSSTTAPTTTAVTTTLPPWPALAAVSEQADRIAPERADIVSIYNSGALTSSVEAQAIAAAQQAGARATIRHAASIGMTSVRRDGASVQTAPSGFAYPMGTTVLESAAVATFMGTGVADALDDDRVVMSSLTASLRGAVAGDVITLTASSGASVEFTIGAVVEDAITGGTELLMTPAAADRIGLERKSSVIIWDFPDRVTMDQAMVDNDLISTRIRIRRSWDPFDPDTTLGMAKSKELLGEFAYRVNANGSVSIDTDWSSANLPSGRRLLNNSIQIRARCHNEIEPALREALAEVASAGLASTINVFDANRAGGCYNPRFNRLAQNSSIGFLSRHTWGMAIDTNTVGSCQGCAPPDMNCQTVRIFRKHGFAWGGNFLTPDGMHFEFVGQSRHQFPYPSRYCQNTGSNLIDTDAELPLELTERPTFFADAGLVAEHEH